MVSAQHEVGLFEAKTRLSELVQEVAAGETWTITRRGTPVARLVPVQPHPQRAAALRRLGHLRRDILAAGGGISVAQIQQWRDEGRR